MNNETESQTQMILQHMQEGNSITAIAALEKFGCFRLASRIHDIRSLGYQVEVEHIKRGGKSFAEYKMGDEQGANPSPAPQKGGKCDDNRA